MDKFKVLLMYPNEPMVGVIPSNLAYLSACLKEAGHDVRLFDTSLYKSIRYAPRRDNWNQQKETTKSFDSVSSQDELRTKMGHVKTSNVGDYQKMRETSPHSDFADLVEDWKPNLIATTTVDSTIEFTWEFIEEIRGKRPKVIMGGVGATFNYDRILNSGYVDYVNVGEGEGSLPELCGRLQRNEDCYDIKNIYLKGPDGKIITNPQRPRTDIDELPMPDFSIYEEQRFYRPFMGRVVRMVQIDWDRGCPYQCTYCAAPAIVANNRKEKIGNYYRVKNEDKIFEEMKFLIKTYSLDFMYISSETLCIIPWEKFKRLGERYIKEIGLPFWCQSRLDSFTEERTELLKRMGCQSVSVGLEHGSEKVRMGILRKQLRNDKVLDGFKTLAKYNIRPTVNSMMGLPDETREEVFETLELNRKIAKILKGNRNLNIFTFVPFHGTALRTMCINKGYVNPEEPIPFSFYKESMLTMPQLSKEEIAGLEKTAHLYIELPKSYYPKIKIAEKDDKKGRKMFDELSNIFQKIKAKQDDALNVTVEEDHLSSPMVNFGGKIDLTGDY